MSDVVEKNRAHFNDAAATYNSKFEKTIEQLIKEIQARRDWIGVDWVSDSDSDDETEAENTSKPAKTVRLLDYACGTGLVSRALAPYVTQCIGVDISENMVEAYNNSASNQGLPASEMHAVVGNLLSSSADDSSLSSPELFGFDLAVVGLGFHHFENPALAAQKLAQRLKKGGVLLIIDFLPHEHFFHGHDGHGDKGDDDKAKHTVTHMGFSEDQVKAMFEGAGVGEKFEYVVMGKGVVFVKKDAEDERKEMRRSVFMAKGVKL